MLKCLPASDMCFLANDRQETDLPVTCDRCEYFSSELIFNYPEYLGSLDKRFRDDVTGTNGYTCTRPFYIRNTSDVSLHIVGRHI